MPDGPARQQSWCELDRTSPDLSTKDPARAVSSGGIIGGDLGQLYGEVVFSIAPSDVRMGLIRAGTSDRKGLAHDGRRQELE
jgi:hypothetical protein